MQNLHFDYSLNLPENMPITTTSSIVHYFSMGVAFLIKSIIRKMNRFNFTIWYIFFSGPLYLQAQVPDPENGLVKWMKLEDAMQALERQPKPLIVDFYTDWCGWCKHMMRTTYSNPTLAAYINQNFYPVKFNAEGKDTVTFLGNRYGPMNSGPRATHSLAYKLLQGKMAYPSTLFLNNFDKQKNEFALNLLTSGYLDERKIEPLLVFTLENVFRNSPYEEFKENFEKAFYDSLTKTKYEKLEWENIKSALARNQGKGKKTFVLIHTDWCNSCKVMKRTTFIHDSSAAYIRDKFHLVEFNPETTETLTYKGVDYTNPRTPQFPFHQLALVLTRNNFILPTLVVLDEELNLLDAVPFYIQPSFIKDISYFYGENIYRQKTWQEYIAQKYKK
ncbi:MAG: thioredoxin family protein [Chitinophagales bacterium]|nr:thioredoxin family protein [Chitinophagales bacterium]MDW8418365.1 thioredoxin family protein [Chitinophagales bacterium]